MRPFCAFCSTGASLLFHRAAVLHGPFVEEDILFQPTHFATGLKLTLTSSNNQAAVRSISFTAAGALAQSLLLARHPSRIQAFVILYDSASWND
jgi:hypothetical protein